MATPNRLHVCILRISNLRSFITRFLQNFIYYLFQSMYWFSIYSLPSVPYKNIHQKSRCLPKRPLPVLGIAKSFQDFISDKFNYVSCPIYSFQDDRQNNLYNYICSLWAQYTYSCVSQIIPSSLYDQLVSAIENNSNITSF